MKLLLPAASLCLFGCATTSTLSSLTTPSQVQADLTVAGSLVVSKVSATAKADIHTFATDLLSLSTATLTSAEIQSFVPANVPAADQALVTGLIDGGTVVINL